MKRGILLFMGRVFYLKSINFLEYLLFQYMYNFRIICKFVLIVFLWYFCEFGKIFWLIFFKVFYLLRVYYYIYKREKNEI